MSAPWESHRVATDEGAASNNQQADERARLVVETSIAEMADLCAICKNIDELEHNEASAEAVMDIFFLTKSENRHFEYNLDGYQRGEEQKRT